MTGVTTGQTALTTATDSDDTEVYLTIGLVAALQALANLFESATGHAHNGAGKGAPVAASSVSGSLTNSQLAADVARANQLVNGGFEINQRGGTITANNAYAHDRWQILLGGTSTISVTDETTIVDTGSGHSLKAVYTHNANSQIDQKLEDFRSLRGRTLSLSFRVRQGSASNVRPYISDSGSKTFGTASATTGAFATLTVSLAIGAAATSVNIGVDLGASDTVYLDNANLTVSTVASDYVPLPAADDFARCLRYYEVLMGGVAANEPAMAGQATSATAGLSLLQYTPKAVTPTITVSASGDFALVTAAGGQQACTSLTFNNIGPRTALGNWATASGMVAGNGTLVIAANTNARIRVEANP